jgi:hypothetical protein
MCQEHSQDGGTKCGHGREYAEHEHEHDREAAAHSPVTVRDRRPEFS